MFEISKIAYDLYVQNWIDEHTTPDLRLQNIREYHSYVRECSIDGNEPNTYEDWLSEYGFHGSVYVCYEEFCDMEYHDKDHIRSLLGEDDTLIEMYYRDIEELLDKEALGCGDDLTHATINESKAIHFEHENEDINKGDLKSDKAREVATKICDLFEEILDRYDITIPDDEREGAEDEARLYGSTYYAFEDRVVKCLNTFAEQNKYNIAKKVDLENFKFAMECLDYSPEDYTEKELQDMFDTLFDKLSNDDIYNGIYNENLEDVISEYEKPNNLDSRISEATQRSKEMNKDDCEKSEMDLEI